MASTLFAYYAYIQRSLDRSDRLIRKTKQVVAESKKSIAASDELIRIHRETQRGERPRPLGKA